jgi:CDP-diacylglycerol--glycerol-3-phosphate 3-phosphatidyltransferase
MLTEALRKRLQGLKKCVAGRLVRNGVDIRIVSAIPPFVAWIFVFPLLATGHIDLGLLLVVLSFPLDAVDGMMAAELATPKPLGRFIDVMADRIADCGLWAGIILLAANQFQGPTLPLCVIAAAAWHLQSQTTIAGEAAGAQVALGPIQRTERLLVISVGLLLSSVGLRLGLSLGAGTIIVAGIPTIIHRILSIRSQL